jgi:hypothetical protein
MDDANSNAAARRPLVVIFMISLYSMLYPPEFGGCAGDTTPNSYQAMP